LSNQTKQFTSVFKPISDHQAELFSSTFKSMNDRNTELLSSISSSFSDQIKSVLESLGQIRINPDYFPEKIDSKKQLEVLLTNYSYFFISMFH
jgi:hypothetical protein